MSKTLSDNDVVKAFDAAFLISPVRNALSTIKRTRKVLASTEIFTHYLAGWLKYTTAKKQRLRG